MEKIRRRYNEKKNRKHINVGILYITFYSSLICGRINYIMYVHIAQVQDFMRKQGIPRGFAIETLRKNRRSGKFNVPYIKVGSTPYFKETDLINYLERQEINDY